MNLLPWVIGAPLTASVLLFVWRGMPRALAALLGVGSVFVSAALVAVLTVLYLPAPTPYTHLIWTWFEIGELTPQIALYLDGLSLNMLWVITGVGSLIHLYAAWYMRDDHRDDGGFRRFFAYMNLFVASMLLLVLGDNLLSLYFGWEGVGLCSYLLIGFWYADPENGYAARKAFVTTRVGDTLMAIGLFLLVRELGTLNIREILDAVPRVYASGAPELTLIAFLLLGGAVGKSAQLPLQTWLPDAMAGPTPVSALIHAATMVTAGVYLIARLHGVFDLAPAALSAVGWVGALTLLLAGGAALVQRDIKRILAYSTMSQIGYMFLALGAGAYSAAIFHLMTHAFFKALLFMAAGYVILALHHEQDIFSMGGLRKKLPLAFWSFLAGSAALAAVPWVTAGYYSKDAILFAAWGGGHLAWWAIGVAGAFLTGLYIFRLMFIVFWGEARAEAHDDHRWSLRIPLGVLTLLSVVGGAIIVPAAQVLPEVHEAHPPLVLAVQIIIALSGIALAWYWYGRATQHAPAMHGLRALAFHAWGFDWLYERLLLRPWMALARFSKPDAADEFYTLLARGTQAAHRQAIASQNGQLRWYLAAIVTGALVLLGAVLWS